MKWSPKVGRLTGLSVSTHFTFLRLPSLLAFSYRRSPQRIEEPV